MYGVPENLDLSHFIGTTLIQIPLGEFQVQFVFHPTGTISIEGKWELIDANGIVIDRAMENAQRSAFYVHRLLGQNVVAFEINPPESFLLKFANGLALRVSDDSPSVESFSIHPGDIYV